ncbi:MAG: helical backbone metal receptor [Desulfobacterales bacterium]|nr:helical backbone metal receptor [Desulfobacterales bacterium]
MDIRSGRRIRCRVKVKKGPPVYLFNRLKMTLACCFSVMILLLLTFPPVSISAVRTIDSQGTRLEFSELPERIVSLVPSAAEILVAIGAGDRLIGSTYHDTTLKGSGKRTIIGGFFNPSLGRIKSLAPDLVIAAPLHKDIIRTFRGAGTPVFVYTTPALDHAWELMAAMGEISGRETAADELIRENRSQLSHVRAKIDKIAQKTGRVPKRVIRLMGRNKIMTPGNTSFQNEMIRAAGGVAPDFGKPGPVVDVSLDEWQDFNPEMIYGCYSDRKVADRFFSQPGWKDVDAVRNQRIHYLPCDLTCRASTRTGAFVAGLASMIYTEEFANPDLFVHSVGSISRKSLNEDLAGSGLDYVDSAGVISSHVFDFVNKTLVVDLKTPMTVLSTLEGKREGITTVGNHYSPPPTWFPGHARGIDDIRNNILKAVNRKRETTSFMMTGANMDYLSVQTRSYKDMKVTALVTAGVMTNAVRMGFDKGMYYEPAIMDNHGTINIILMTNMRLSDRAMTRAIISATEAKSAVMQDFDIRSFYTPKPHMATGTGTDNVLVVRGKGTPIDNAGGHSKMGELIARAVYAAVTEAVAGQNGVVPGRHVVQRLTERGISIYQLTSGAQCGCQEKKGAFSAMVEQLFLNPVYAGFMEAALSLSDAHVQGLVQDLNGFDAWCEQIASRIAGHRVDGLENLVSDETVPVVIRKAMNAVMTGARIRTGEGE